MSNQLQTVPERVSNWVKTWVATQNTSETPQIEMLAGDGSQRNFFRVSMGPRTVVVLDDKSWVSSKDYAPHQEYLLQRGIAVPRFLSIDETVGIGVLEDLGDELLQSTIRRVQKNREVTMNWFKMSVALLADLHGKTYPVPKTLPASTRFFDEEKYTHEMKFTWEHLVKGFLKMDTPFPERAMRKYCYTLGAMGPPVFCHRDYHTRNILVFNQKLFLIDFQDARLGSPVYDLASLLYDPYVALSSDEREELEQHYRASLSSYSVSQSIFWKNFSHDLKWVAIQRLVKAAGSFASFYTRFQRPAHLVYLLPALQSVQKLLTECKVPQDLFPVAEWISRSQAQLAELGIKTA